MGASGCKKQLVAGHSDYDYSKGRGTVFRRGAADGGTRVSRGLGLCQKKALNKHAGVIALPLPGGDLSAQRLAVRARSVQALTDEHSDLGFADVQLAGLVSRE